MEERQLHGRKTVTFVNTFSFFRSCHMLLISLGDYRMVSINQIHLKIRFFSIVSLITTTVEKKKTCKDNTNDSRRVSLARYIAEIVWEQFFLVKTELL